MNLMELRLQQVLQENRADFIDSLRLSGIDVEHNGWNADAIDKNAQAGALSLIQFVSQENISDWCRDITPELEHRKSGYYFREKS